MEKMRKEKVDVKEIRIRLHQELPRLRQEYAVRSLGLFGSYVRGEHRRGSDLDVLVEFFQVPGRKPSFHWQANTGRGSNCMKRPRLVHDYLRDILDAMDKAEEFVLDLDLLAFRMDDKTAFAVIRSLEIIGKAAKKIPPDQRRRFPKIPWKSLTGMRDKLIHDYVGVSLEIVWRTVKEDIPSLRSNGNDTRG